MVALGVGNSKACKAMLCAPKKSADPLTLISAPFQPGSLLAETTPGVRSTYFSPAPVSDPSRPARVVLSGPDAPDPFVLVESRREYLYTSDGTLKGFNVPAYTRLAGGSWDLRDVLPRLPSWAIPGFTWAPDVHRVAGGWALYFTAAVNHLSPSMQCIGDAFGSSPLGPFVANPKLFICQVSHRGSIDPRTFVDAQGDLWLYWKSDDNADPDIPWTTGNGYTGIWVQRLSSDGKNLLGKPKLVMQPTLPWEGTIIRSARHACRAGPLLDVLFRGLVQLSGLRHRSSAMCGTNWALHANFRSPADRDELARIGPGRALCLRGCLGHLDHLQPLEEQRPRTYTEPTGCDGGLGFTTQGPYVAKL